MTATRSYFSVPAKSIATGKPLTFDLYINSSAIENREKFVRIYPKGETISDQDVQNFQTKYRQLYVDESDRSNYLKSLCQSSGRNEVEKVSVLKDSAIHYLSELFDHDKVFTTETLNQTILGCRDVVENLVDTLQNSDIDRLRELIASLSFHDFYTFDHSINVSMYCISTYRVLDPGAKREAITLAGLSGLLHDVGKIRVSTEIINKAGKLTDEEFAEIKKHPGYGAEFMLNPGLNLPVEIDPHTIARVIGEHHENVDGTGYPNRIPGKSIHVMAKVCAIADFFDAITTKRSYHAPLSIDDALGVMRKTCGKKIDPHIFEIFAAHVSKSETLKPTTLEIAKDFDPCQPHEHLPMSASNAIEKKTEASQFGRIRIVGKAEDFGKWSGNKNVDFIDPPESGSTPPKKKTGT